ncbi:MAG: glycosyltransferase family 4 protein [Clostridia bacterium]|nr:glycosyltransferase family 4 protein [Clostridia bacterium]
MKIAFLTIGKIENISSSGIYTSILLELTKRGHEVYLISANEKRSGQETVFKQEEGVNWLSIKIGNITKCGMIEKGISTLTIESLFIKGIKRYLSNVKFDLVIYSTPPITFCNVVKFIKKRDGAKSYLLLKDIFPQNAIDIGVLSKGGLKGIIYKYFRNKEKKLYALSDYIGCMSPANCEYVLKNNQEVSADRVEVCPNSRYFTDLSLDKAEANVLREKYGLPLDKKIFIYGGNLGKPQGIPFLIECIKTQKDNNEAFFLVVGDGTEYTKLKEFEETEKQSNFKLMQRLPKEDYDRMVAACDVGMIFLDKRFTIPNYPSRLLSYMMAGVPVLACTDVNTDVGKTIVDGGFGWWCESRDAKDFSKLVKQACTDDTALMKEKMKDYFLANFTSEKACDIILKHF